MNQYAVKQSLFLADLINEIMNRNKLAKQLKELRESEKIILAQLKEIDKDDVLKKLHKYVGKCYLQKEKNWKKYKRAFYIYSVDTETQKLNSLEVSFWDEQETYFNITYSEYFHPHDKIGTEKYKEISMSEFMKHYRIAQKKISKTITAKNNVV